MKSSWERHNGKSFFYARYGNVTMDQLREECAAVEREMAAQPPKSVLLMVDSREAPVSPEAINSYKAHATNSKRALRKIAIMRMPGWKAFVVDIVLPFSGLDEARQFEDEQAAKDWLVAS